MNKQIISAIALLFVGSASASCFDAAIENPTPTNPYFTYSYYTTLSASATCTHDAFYDFRLFWSLYGETSYTNGDNTMATV